MRRSLVFAVAAMALVALGAAACSSSPTSSTATTSTASTRAAFCSANDSLDKAGANVTSAAGFLAVLKQSSATLDELEKDAPAGKLGQDVRALVKGAKAAVASNNANDLNNPALNSAGADLDTYCGVDGDGNPLPADFAAGKGTAFCSTAASINQGTNAASDAAGVLSFLEAHQSLITQYSSEVPSLPSSIQAEAQTLVSTAQAAIAANNSSTLGTQTIMQDSMDVQLYCGQNS
jgi:hypothetical protein